MATQDASVRIGFIGAGRMARALAQGLLAAEFTTADKLLASDVFATARSDFTKETGSSAVKSNTEVLEKSQIVTLSIKPQQMGSVLTELQGKVTAEHLVVSIAAGVSVATITRALGQDCRVVRVMPNTPCLVGASASGFAIGGAATREDAELVERMLSTVGVAIEVPEKLLDAVTGLSGSGPAYVYQIIEALSDGGVCVGLPRDIATKLAAQTVFGAAKMVLESELHPGELKNAVASPGGTTIAGLHTLEKGGLRGCLMDAVLAATRRSQELGKPA